MLYELIEIKNILVPRLPVCRFTYLTIFGLLELVNPCACAYVAYNMMQPHLSMPEIDIPFGHT